jgi:hypothetical protein
MLMLELYISLALLGLTAIDPVGIGAMLILLVQKHPYKRSFVFLAGSFTSLMVMGLLFAKGLGRIVQTYEHNNSWFVPGIEVVAAVVLLIVAVTVYVRLKTNAVVVKPSHKVQKWLQMGNGQLFLFGAGLVAGQSVIDVVFIIAMVRTGQFSLSDVLLVGAVATYALAALLFQAIIILVFKLTPTRQRTRMVNAMQVSVAKYSSQALIIISLSLSFILFFAALVK